MRWMWLGVVAMASAAFGGAPAEEPGVKGTVETVTLYRGQALVTRSVPVDAGAGRVELVVASLPQQIVPDSLFAEGGDGLDIRAVRFRTRAVGEEPRDDIRKLDGEIEIVQDKMARNKKMQEIITQRLAFLGKMEDFAAPTAKTDLAKGVLNFDALKQIALFDFEQRTTAADEALKLATEDRELAKQLSVLQRQRSDLTAGATRTVREAILFLEKRAPEKATIKLSYLVSEAGWTPAYNFRSSKDGKQVQVEYNAIVHQMSGENWDGVTLSLSTASPALGAQGPGLAPFRVSLSAMQEAPQQAKEPDVAKKLQFAQKRLRDFEGRQRASQDLRDNRQFNWDMNAAANEFQGVELTAGDDVLRRLTAEPAQGEVTSVSYALAGPVSLASRSDQQMLRIADMALESRFYHAATPILTSYVYREAEMTNSGAEALLAGPVSVYLDGRFVGRGEIPTVARGETFVMGFGADGQLRARRELVEKVEAVQGANRELTLNYRLVLENYKDAPTTVRLFDRMPVAENKNDIRVTLGEMKEKLSTDKLYVRLEQPKGILRWDVEVPAHAAGETAKTIEYSYKMEFPRTLDISTPAPAAMKDMQIEFEQLQERRALH